MAKKFIATEYVYAKKHNHKITKETWSSTGNLHSFDDEPCLIVETYDTTLSFWAKNGILHRDGGLPATVESGENGEKNLEFMVNGVLHRDNGPALCFEDYKNRSRFFIYGKEYGYVDYIEKLRKIRYTEEHIIEVILKYG